MKKDWSNGTFTIDGTDITNLNRDSDSFEKHVSFAERSEDDVAYIYPWSPTKYLLFGKYTENELEMMKRKKHQTTEHCNNNDDQIAPRDTRGQQNNEEHHLKPILKRTRKDHKNKKYRKERGEEGSTTSESDNNDNLNLSNQSSSLGSECFPLEEISICKEENEQNSDKEQSVLPSMVIFSPSEIKDLYTNNRKDIGTRDNRKPKPGSALGTVKLKQQQRRRRSQRKIDHNDTIDKNGCTNASSADLLPLIPSPNRLNEAVFGCIKNIDDMKNHPGSTGDGNDIVTNSKRKKMGVASASPIKMPCIINRGGSQVKPLIKSKLSQRFQSTTSYNSNTTKSCFDNIQLLREENFIDENFTASTTDGDFIEEKGSSRVVKFNENRCNQMNKHVIELPTIADAYRSNRNNGNKRNINNIHQKYKQKLAR